MKTYRMLYRLLSFCLVLTILLFFTSCSKESEQTPEPEKAPASGEVVETPAQPAEQETKPEPAPNKYASFASLGPGEFDVCIDVELQKTIKETVDEMNSKYSAPIRLNSLWIPEYEKVLAELARENERDVFITLDSSFYDEAIKQDFFDEGKAIAYDTPVIVVMSGNPKGVTGLADFAREDLKIGMTEENTYSGQVTRSMLEKAGVNTSELFLSSSSPDEAMIVTSLLASHIDVIITHKSIPMRMKGVENLEFIEIEAESLIENPIKLFRVKSSKDPKLVEEFTELMLSEEVQQSFEAFGYRPAK